VYYNTTNTAPLPQDRYFCYLKSSTFSSRGVNQSVVGKPREFSGAKQQSF